MIDPLTHRDFETGTGIRLRAHLEARIAELRESNDSRVHDAEATAFLRGGIKELKDLLALATAPASEDGHG